MFRFWTLCIHSPNRFICRGSHGSPVAMTSNSEVPRRLCRSCRQIFTKIDDILPTCDRVFTFQKSSNAGKTNPGVSFSLNHKDNATTSRGVTLGYRVGGGGIGVGNFGIRRGRIYIYIYIYLYTSVNPRISILVVDEAGSSDAELSGATTAP